VERACASDDFRPNRSRLCDWCSFQAYCPAWGGDPELAAALRPEPVLLPA
jgi:putative RecB family exonuclease